MMNPFRFKQADSGAPVLPLKQTPHSPPAVPKRSSWTTMHSFLLSLASVASLALLGVRGGPSGAHVAPRQSSLEAYIQRETPIAWAGLFANIGDRGAKDNGAAKGVVIASPTKVDPDYVFTWIRDSSLVLKVIIDTYTHSPSDHPEFRSLIEDWVASMTRIQQVSNPSGSLTTGGLGEPKFHIDETAFTDGWGRPQRDGPALRATSSIKFANYLLSKGETAYVANTLWPFIQLDLEYTSQVWNLTGFDLWEEVSGASFFTSAAQHRALREGVTLASALGKSSGDWATQADNALCFLQSYWTEEGGYIIANANNGPIRSGLDSNTILGSIHTYDTAAGCDATTFQPCSDKALANLKVYVDSFRNGVYPINNGAGPTAPIALGRYFEDVYYNGNPWYLTTLAVSEQLYRAVHTWDAQNTGIKVTAISLAFFRQFDSSITGPTTIAAGSAKYTAIRKAILEWSDGFVAIVAKYTPADGSLAEQFTKDKGTPLSAKDLTWSYASIITAVDARNNVGGENWGASKVVVPRVCVANPGPQSTLTFSVVADTFFGQNVFVTGNLDVIGSWSPTRAFALSSAAYPTWIANVTVPANTNFEYKYIKVAGDGSVVWESDPNRRGTTPAKGQTGHFQDTWK